jgi:hypothetical protein
MLRIGFWCLEFGLHRAHVNFDTDCTILIAYTCEGVAEIGCQQTVSVKNQKLNFHLTVSPNQLGMES